MSYPGNTPLVRKLFTGKMAKPALVRPFNLPNVLLTMQQIRTETKENRETKEKRGFALRTYPARALGLILTGVAFTPVFMEVGHAPWVWVVFVSISCFGLKLVIYIVPFRVIP